MSIPKITKEKKIAVFLLLILFAVLHFVFGRTILNLLFNVIEIGVYWLIGGLIVVLGVFTMLDNTKLELWLREQFNKSGSKVDATEVNLKTCQKNTNEPSDDNCQENPVEETDENCKTDDCLWNCMEDCSNCDKYSECPPIVSCKNDCDDNDECEEKNKL